ncbi:cytochrome P450 [Lentzea sp. NBRC 105346]|uniref:cytochrome P450 n=1 Tax=Lentzea sp. NBRC 105346 TaxID=3032205 RepID=UPI00255308AB|nr:cytochrome P450 [Lentzea sp. NBRC 105346]GLZ33909.1 cytochrome P450 [Lentzea sp. NBRC 105346]
MTELVTTGLPLKRETPLDPPTELHKIREQAHVSRMRMADGHLGWLITGHAEVRALMADNRLSTRSEKHHPLMALPNGDIPERRAAEPGMFLGQDAPDHTRLRRMLTGQFTVRRMNQLAAWIAQIVDEQLKSMRAKGSPVDLVEEFALPVPSLVICELLGVPYEERNRFQDDTAKMLNFEHGFQEMMDASQRVVDYVGELVARKKVEPGEDMLSGLLAAGEATDEEVKNMGFLLLVAGHETTANMLGLGTFTLLQHPDQLELLKNDPSLIDNAVEELLRYLTIVHFGTIRTALVDFEFQGHQIKAGDTLSLHLPTANRDPEKFQDPDRLDILRPATGHVTFGHGIHQCLGQQLARIEMRVGFTALFREFPDLRLDVPASEVPMRTNMSIYGVHSLPVAWSV